MPKVGTYGEIHFPKGMTRLDQEIVKKVINIKDCEKKVVEINQEIHNARAVILNLQTRQRNLEATIRRVQNELFDLYDDKVFRDTVAFNR